MVEIDNRWKCQLSIYTIYLEVPPKIVITSVYQLNDSILAFPLLVGQSDIIDHMKKIQLLTETIQLVGLTFSSLSN